MNVTASSPTSEWPRLGMRDRVRGQLHDRLGDALRVQDRPAGRGPGQHPGPVIEGTGLSGQLPGQHFEVGRGQAEEIGPLGLGQQQQVVDEAGHSREFVGGYRQGLRVVAGRGLHRVEIALDDGDGGAQLVSDVGEKHALSGERRLQPVEHAVERGRQLAGLGPAATGYARGQVTVGDLPREVGRLANRAKHPARRQPGQGRAEQQGHQSGFQLKPGSTADSGLLWAGEHRGHEDAAAAIGGDADRDSGVAGLNPAHFDGPGGGHTDRRPSR